VTARGQAGRNKVLLNLPGIFLEALAEKGRSKIEYRGRFPGRDAEDLKDEDLLREVMNTVGKAGKLGEHVKSGDEPYDKLKRALWADIDEAAWTSLYSTVSRPFAKPASGKIAVKVINHYGDEVLKVFEV
jgi:hypothetical protein